MKHAYLDEYSHLNSFLNRLDPRIKIISFFGLILCIVLTDVPAYPVFYLYAALISVLIALSGIPLFFILKKSLVVIPFVVMVSFFTLFKDSNGWLNFSGIVAKGYLCVLCMIILVSGTRFPELLSGLEKLRIPKIMIMIISFMYRYIFVVQDEMGHMNRARQSRSCARGWRHNTKAMANMLGVLFIRSYERAEAVYLAMCARGFDGTVRTINKFHMRMADLAFLFAITIFLVVVRRLAY